MSRGISNASRFLAIAAGLHVLAPMAKAAKEIMSFQRGNRLRDLMRADRYGEEVRTHRTSHRTVAMDRRAAAKRRNVLRNRRAHK